MKSRSKSTRDLIEEYETKPDLGKNFDYLKCLKTLDLIKSRMHFLGTGEGYDAQKWVRCAKKYLDIIEALQKSKEVAALEKIKFTERQKKVLSDIEEALVLSDPVLIAKKQL